MSTSRNVVVTGKPLDEKKQQDEYKVCQEIAEYINNVRRKMATSTGLNSNIGMLRYSNTEEEKEKDHLLIGISGSQAADGDSSEIKELVREITTQGDWAAKKEEWSKIVGDIELIDSIPPTDNAAVDQYGYGSSRKLLDAYNIETSDKDPDFKKFPAYSFIVTREKPPKLYFKIGDDAKKNKPLPLGDSQKEKLQKFINGTISKQEIQQMIRDDVSHTHYYKCCEPKLAAEREKRMLFSENFVDKGEIYFLNSPGYNSVSVFESSMFDKLISEEETLQNQNTIALRLNGDSRSVDVMAYVDDKEKPGNKKLARITLDDQKLIEFVISKKQQKSQAIPNKEIIKSIITAITGKNLEHPIFLETIKPDKKPSSVNSCEECQLRKENFRRSPMALQSVQDEKKHAEDIPRPLSPSRGVFLTSHTPVPAKTYTLVTGYPKFITKITSATLFNNMKNGTEEIKNHDSIIVNLNPTKEEVNVLVRVQDEKGQEMIVSSVIKDDDIFNSLNTLATSYNDIGTIQKIVDKLNGPDVQATFKQTSAKLALPPDKYSPDLRKAVVSIGAKNYSSVKVYGYPKFLSLSRTTELQPGEIVLNFNEEKQSLNVLIWLEGSLKPTKPTKIIIDNPDRTIINHIIKTNQKSYTSTFVLQQAGNQLIPIIISQLKRQVSPPVVKLTSSNSSIKQSEKKLESKKEPEIETKPDPSKYVKQAIAMLGKETKDKKSKKNENHSDLEAALLWAKAMKIDPKIEDTVPDKDKAAFNKLGCLWFSQQAGFHFDKGKKENDNLSLENAVVFYNHAIYRLEAYSKLTGSDSKEELGHYYAQRAMSKFLLNKDNHEIIQDWKKAVSLSPKISTNTDYYNLTKLKTSQVSPAEEQSKKTLLSLLEEKQKEVVILQQLIDKMNEKDITPQQAHTQALSKLGISTSSQSTLLGADVSTGLEFKQREKKETPSRKAPASTNTNSSVIKKQTGASSQFPSTDESKAGQNILQRELNIVTRMSAQIDAEIKYLSFNKRRDPDGDKMQKLVYASQWVNLQYQRLTELKQSDDISERVIIDCFEKIYAGMTAIMKERYTNSMEQDELIGSVSMYLRGLSDSVRTHLDHDVSPASSQTGKPKDARRQKQALSQTASHMPPLSRASFFQQSPASKSPAGDSDQAEVQYVSSNPSSSSSSSSSSSGSSGSNSSGSSQERQGRNNRGGRGSGKF